MRAQLRQKRNFAIIAIVLLTFSVLIGKVNAQSYVTRWAVLVSGTIDCEVRSTQFDTQFMYHILVDHYGISEDRIYYLHANMSYPYRGVDAEATKNNVRCAIREWLAHNVSSHDWVFIYFTSHGYYGSDGARGDPTDETDEDDEAIQLDTTSGGINYYWDDELREDLALVNCWEMFIVVSTCFSGGFIRDLSATNRIIMTPTTEDQWSAGDIDGDEFCEWDEVFMDALHWYVDGNDTKWLNEQIYHNTSEPLFWKYYPDTPDTKQDCFMSMWEVWNFAWRHDDGKIGGLDCPCIDDNGDGEPTYRDTSGNLIGMMAETPWTST